MTRLIWIKTFRNIILFFWPISSFFTSFVFLFFCWKYNLRIQALVLPIGNLFGRFPAYIGEQIKHFSTNFTCYTVFSSDWLIFCFSLPRPDQTIFNTQKLILSPIVCFHLFIFFEIHLTDIFFHSSSLALPPIFYPPISPQFFLGFDLLLSPLVCY